MFQSHFCCSAFRSPTVEGSAHRTDARNWARGAGLLRSLRKACALLALRLQHQIRVKQTDLTTYRPRLADSVNKKGSGSYQTTEALGTKAFAGAATCREPRKRGTFPAPWSEHRCGCP